MDVERIDSTTEEGKERLNELLIDAIMNSEPDEELSPPFVVHKRNYKSYEQALIMLSYLLKQGKITFEYDPIYKAYPLHCVFVHLVFDDNGFAKLEDAKEVSELISKFEGFTTDNQDSSMWNLSIPIYFPKD